MATVPPAVSSIIETSGLDASGVRLLADSVHALHDIQNRKKATPKHVEHETQEKYRKYTQKTDETLHSMLKNDFPEYQKIRLDDCLQISVESEAVVMLGDGLEIFIFTPILSAFLKDNWYTHRKADRKNASNEGETGVWLQGGRRSGGRGGRLRSYSRPGEESTGAVQESAARDARGGRGRGAWTSRVPASVQTSPLELFPRGERSGLRPRGRSRDERSNLPISDTDFHSISHVCHIWQEKLTREIKNRALGSQFPGIYRYESSDAWRGMRRGGILFGITHGVLFDQDF
ncbi:hypothetical protein WN51_12444 [Melipona quadrifasciata]|uniref:Uncharacterized protein n=1 Tax=Melipona quadrifasciata TaxID=166423 RepID=A0A0N0BHH7_9HYME|nr:hypothetical protein WN51_12444 [Melipona quadrifasciata]